MFRTFTGSGNPAHTDTRRQIGAAVGIGLTLATQFSHATHLPSIRRTPPANGRTL
jgi:hypothetical protein